MAALCAAGSAGAPPPHASGECRPGPDLRYGINVSKIENASVVLRFVQLGEDDETRAFMRNFCSGAENEWTDSAAAAMKKFMSLTDANAILDRGKMFVLSATHARRLLQGSFPADGSADEWSPRTLLDIGAGDGSTTLEIMRAIQAVPEKVCATEASKSMAWRLRQKGFECVETCDLGHAKFERQQDGGTFDVIMCLNVLDRADLPATLLRDIRRRMKPGSSRLLIAMVLPFCPFVECGTKQKRPTEDLNMDGGRCIEGASFEAAAERFITRVLEPAGFTVHNWTTVPYICSGDRVQTHYVLQDFVATCSVPDGTGNDSEARCEDENRLVEVVA